MSPFFAKKGDNLLLKEDSISVESEKKLKV